MKRKKCLKKIVCTVFAMALFISLMFNTSCCYAADPELPSVEIEGVIYSKTEENGEPVALVSGYDKKNLPDEADVCILENVEIEGDFCTVKSIGESAFMNCTKIRSIITPPSVVSIGMKAFFCSSIESAKLEGAVLIESEAFCDCNNLISVDIEDDETLIEEFAFGWCRKLSQIKIPNNFECIKKGAFSLCSNIKNLTIPGNMKSIPYAAFSRVGIKTVVIEEGVESICASAFSNCEELTTVQLPKSMNKIGDEAFYCCKELVDIEIPDNVRSMGLNVFKECLNLSKIRINPCFNGTICKLCLDWGNEICFPEIIFTSSERKVTLFGREIDISSIIESNGIVYGVCSDNSKQAIVIGCTSQFKTFEDEPKIENKINYQGVEYNVFAIADGAFHCCNFYSVQIPESIEFIGSCAFYRCKNLDYVFFSDSVRVIGEYAFYGCSSFKYMSIPGTVKVIGEYAFSKSSIESLEIKNGVDEIEKGAFSGCKSLISVIIPGSVRIVPDCAFSECKKLQSLTLEEGVEELQGTTLDGCKDIRKIDLPKSLKRIGKAFSYCSISSYNLTIPGSVKTIEDEAFLFAKGFKVITIEEGVERIGDSFCCCDDLEKVILPKSLKVISSYAFRNCPHVISVVFPKREGFWGEESEIFMDNEDCEITWVTVEDEEPGIILT